MYLLKLLSLIVLLSGCVTPKQEIRMLGCDEVKPGIFRCNRQTIENHPELDKYRIRGNPPPELCEETK